MAVTLPIIAKAGARAHGLVRPSCLVVIGILAFAALPASAGALAAFGSRERASVAASTPGDRSATHTLLSAEEVLAKAILARTVAIEAAVVRGAKALGHECKGVLRGAPDESVLEEEGPSASTPTLSGRAQGELARSELEKQTIDLEISETSFAPVDRVLRSPYNAYIATVDRLTWSDPTINALVQQTAARLREDLAGPRVPVCPEMRAWAASGFHVLPPASKRLQEAREARSKQIVQGNLRSLLRPYEGPAEKAIVRHTTALRERFRERERMNESEPRAELDMELALGERVSRFAEQRVAPVIAKGHTSAGGTFVIRRRIGKSSRGSCKHEVDVEINERDGSGSGSNACLGEDARSRPSGSCSGPPGPVETIEFATPPAVRRVRVRFSNGRTVTASVAQIPTKEGGPAGLFIDAFRGYHPYPVSAQELDRKGKVLRTLSLNQLRCTKVPPGGPSGGPQFIDLATVTTPYGEPLTIQGTLLRFGGHTEFSLGPQSTRGNQVTSEELGQSKQFQWSLSTECAAHPYTLIDGILIAPDASVLVRTQAGLTPLTKVELAASTHAPGPLFYGVYTTPPTEIIVERSNGSTLYTENITAKATEETEFCEGYAEP